MTVADHDAAGAIGNAHFVQRVQDHLALIRRLAVERNAGNNVDILAETKVFEDLLGENRRLPGCNGNADAGRL